MQVEDLNCSEHLVEIKKFYIDSRENDEMSAKKIRQYLTQNVSTIEKHYPVVLVMCNPLSGDLNSPLRGCDFYCDSWRGSYNYPAAKFSTVIYDVETVVKNLKAMHNKTVSGYKGGEYVLDEEDCVYLVQVFSSAGLSTTVVDICVIDGVVYLATKDDMY